MKEEFRILSWDILTQDLTQFRYKIICLYLPAVQNILAIFRICSAFVSGRT